MKKIEKNLGLITKSQQIFTFRDIKMIKKIYTQRLEL